MSPRHRSATGRNPALRAVIDVALGASLTLLAACGAPQSRTSPVTPTTTPAPQFVRVEGTRFTVGTRPYRFIGANFWAALNLAAAGPTGDRPRLLRELDRLRALGVTNVRVMAGTEGPDDAPWRVVPAMQTAPGVYDPAVLDGLDYLLAELHARGIYAVLCLNNFWEWSGGMAQYRAWRGAGPVPYPRDAGHNVTEFQDYAAGFYAHAEAVEDFRRHVAFVVRRTNRYTHVPYAQDPTIMAWELANEPHGGHDPEAMRRWIHATASLIKSLDPHHLVTTGSEGQTRSPEWAGIDFVRDHASPAIDYMTFHLWVQNWAWFDPRNPDGYPEAEAHALEYVREHIAMAARVGKPAVLEEFGIARDDGSFDPASPTTLRDRYYARLFGAVADASAAGSPIQGACFWAWSGEGLPRAPYGGFWHPGDALTGDPPHEPQGWYGVYARDAATLEVIRTSAARMNAPTP